jgi:hypothetical protein
VIFDRRRIYLIGAAVALLVLVLIYVSRPQITPEQRVREQLALLAHEPWTLVRVQDVQFIGSGDPEQVLLRGVRLDNGAPVVVGFLGKSPYTSPATMQRLREQNLAGRVSEVLLLPRSMAEEPYRTQFQPETSHVGVGFFAGLPEWTAKARTDAPESAAENVPGTPADAVTPADTSSAPARAPGQPG